MSDVTGTATVAAASHAFSHGQGGGSSQVTFSKATVDRLRLFGGAALFTSSSAAAGGPPVQPSPRLGLNVVVADDERANRRVNARLLERLGCKIVLCEDGDEVVAAMAESERLGRPVDAIVLDIVMKRLNGDVLCRCVD